MKKIYILIFFLILILLVSFLVFKNNNNNMGEKTKPEYVLKAEDPNVDPNIVLNSFNESIIFEAIRALDFPTVKILTEKGADLNARGRGGSTPIIVAAMINQWEMVYWLIEKGADPLVQNNVNASVAWLLQESDLDPTSSHYTWANKVKPKLEALGVKFPVSIPNGQ